MKIVWDEPKRKTNFDNRGLDFATLDLEFFGASMIIHAKNGRFKAIGKFGGHIRDLHARRQPEGKDHS
jgi:uncharacterized protein